MFAEFSCGGAAFCLFLAFVFWMWMIGSAVSQTVGAAKKVVKNETVQEVGKGVLAAWLESYFDN